MNPRHDVVIVGGGIHGVGIAQAAAAAGHSVLLLEQRRLAFGASSRSSKLIHGGLRYLESLQFALVRECLAERALLLELAPELVHLVPFYIPIYKDTRRRPWQIRSGLGLYALLAGLVPASRFASVARDQWHSLQGLDTKRLDRVFRYQDAQTDDAMLTAAVMQSAQALGAELVLPATFVRAHRQDDRVSIEYSVNGSTQHCEAAVLINASGAWVNDVLERVTPRPASRAIDLVQGTHILLAKDISAGIFYMEVPEDGRAVFAMPHADGTLVGTTERPFSGDPARVEASVSEQRYLLEVLAHYFPRYREPANQVILSSFAGLRVLPKAEGRAFDRPRETLLIPDAADRPRVLSIYGGKLTTYRATAEKVMTRIRPSLTSRKARADTRTLALRPAA